MGRIGRGWDLTKKSWSVVRSQRALLTFTVISVVAAIVCALVFFGTGAGLIAITDSPWVGLPLMIIGVYLVIVVGVFCGVGLSACTARALDGETVTVGDGIAVARSRLGPILAWAAVQLVVGLLISALQSALRQGVGGLISGVVGGLANLAWTIATFFVIPSIALDGLGPRAALKRSTHLIKTRWGEGLVGTAAISIIAFLIGFLPGAILIGLGVAARNIDALMIVLITLGFLVIAVTALLQTTIATVFRVVLYRFATESRVLGPFSPDELEHAFVSRQGARRFG